MDALDERSLFYGSAAAATAIIIAWLAARVEKKRERRQAFLAWAMDHLRRHPDEPDFVRRVSVSLAEGTYFKASVWKGTNA
jgi:hypothetical protein